MSHKITGVIQYISEVIELETGAKRLSYRIETGDKFNNLYQFDIYKKSEYAEHVDNFVKYNKVGDKVEVEFNVSCREYQGKYYTNLQHWKSEKIEGSTSINALDNAILEPTVDEEDELPF